MVNANSPAKAGLFIFGKIKLKLSLWRIAGTTLVGKALFQAVVNGICTGQACFSCCFKQAVGSPRLVT